MKTFPLSILNINAAGGRRTAYLYTFCLGAFSWTYTSGKDPVIYDGQTFQPAAIEFDQIQNSGAPDDRPVTVRSAHIEPFVSFVGHDLPSAISVFIRRAWLDDLSFTDLLFRGTVDNATDSDAGLELECRGPLSKLDQEFPALIVSTTCTLETYSAQCGVERTAFLVHGSIAAIARNAVTVAAAASKPNGWFAHGYAEVDGVRIGIETHVGSLLQLTVPPTSWQVGQTILLYAGDDHTVATCRTKFGNERRFLGLGIGMPDRNPVTQQLG